MYKIAILFFLISGSLLINTNAFGSVFFADNSFTEDGVQWCEEEKPRHEILGTDSWIKHHKYSIESRICGNLHADPLWAYEGDDRIDKLIERSNFYALAEIEESKIESEKGVNDPTPTDVFEIDEPTTPHDELPESLKDSDGDGVSDDVDQCPRTLTETNVDSMGCIDANQQNTNLVKEPEQGGGCLIATATYGSELAPQVQFLREIRDRTVLNTESGKSFMSGFNQFYYSFSPTIADLERDNQMFKETVKVVITPMLATLSLLNYIDIESEEEMLGYGVGIIMLNAGIYAGLPIFAIITIRKFRK